MTEIIPWSELFVKHEKISPVAGQVDFVALRLDRKKESLELRLVSQNSAYISDTQDPD